MQQEMNPISKPDESKIFLLTLFFEIIRQAAQEGMISDEGQANQTAQAA